MPKNIKRESGFAILALFVIATALVVGTILFANVQTGEKTSTSKVLAAEAGSALRFFGNGVNDIDRVKIRIDGPETKADLGAGDFTLEWWMNADPGNNQGVATCGAVTGWISGNIIFDRDIDGGGDYGDYGISISNGRVAFGVHNGSSERTICGTRVVADNTWHHVAVTRRSGNGEMRIYVDGTLDTTFNGPTGNISYRNNRSTNAPDDPFLVIGAEKHDYSVQSYPSYNGIMDEFRLSNNIRYSASFTRPSAPFVSDASTVLLYHFDEGSGTTAIDSAANPLNGNIRVGGNPTGPVYVTSTAPLGGSLPSPTASTPPSPTATPVSGTPAMIAAYAFEENTGIVASDSSGNGKTLSLSGNPVWSTGRYGRSLTFDGVNDRGSNSSFTLPSQFTYMAWVSNPSNQGYETIVTIGQNRDFYIENGSLSYYDNTERNFGTVPTGSWRHVAITYNGSQLRAYLNGVALGSAQTVSLGSITNTLHIGSWPQNSNISTDYLSANLDEVRIYNGALTQAQVQTAMNTPLSGQPAPTINPTPPPPAPVVNLLANGSGGPITVTSGSSVTLSWTSTGATSCTSSGGWSGSRPTSGSTSTGSLTSTTSYVLTCTGAGGSASDSVTVNVTGGAATPTPLPSATPASGNSSLSFDGSNDTAGTAIIPATGTKTIEAWVRPSTSGQNSIILGNYNDNNGWSLELGSGRVYFWVGNNGNWNSLSTSNSLSSNTWYHVAATYDASTQVARIFINGTQQAQSTIGSIGSVNAFTLGGAAGYSYFNGQLDEVRLSNVLRYTANFTTPSQAFVSDGSTTALYHFNESGQVVSDTSANNYFIYLGGSSSAQSSDPLRITSTAPIN